ncbi:HlyD family type I secretion periplasmic adaptor subunit [Tianweitania sediminis]|jgi:HlyD family type I secretion membrane fusion protein|uniref:Membrane fusion protein (MFP) family protein n=1 Tax=Tianweitania sediminis TaxID=1502156 RepID=A0A8J7R0C7_9HYPH|nr:HlyD family type I secretion periplasmic adaptor subunit [Tianweitania sediminis]MBP0439535.1 HlyD family type I secretion periplasmic adaptor subunit [Tianweitania sediminis]
MLKLPAPNGSEGFSPRPFVVAGYVTIALAFGVFGTWASTAPLSSGVVASGQVAVFSNRKVIQHFEGGIVSDIPVQEGDIVEAGDILARLDQKQAEGNFEILSQRWNLLRATEARLQAEAANLETLEFPPDLVVKDENGEEPLHIRLQRNSFRDRLATKKGQIDILGARIEQLQNEIVGLEAQRESFAEQQSSMVEEITRLTRGQKGGVVATNQVAQLTRSRIEIEGNLGRIIAETAKVNQTIAETRLQILQISQEFVERASNELREVRDQVNETSERVIQARDVLDRTVIRAPVRGMIQNIQIHTKSGVVRPAEPLMDLIPLDDDLIINARIRPIDIDNVSIGNVAEVRLSAFSSRTTPIIFGTVEVLSQDVVQPEDERVEPYYVARVTVAEKDVPPNVKGRLVPGMPADVIFVGAERTLVQYLTKPMADSFSKGLLEQ